MKNTYKIGLIFLGSIALLYFSIFWGTQSGFLKTNRIHYYIDFENVNGLKIADPVLIRGLAIGTVSNIELNDQFCRVEVSIDKKYPLKNKTQAEIQIRELLSGKQLVLFPEGDIILQPGSVIRGTQTFDFSFMISKFGKLVHFFEEQNFDIQKVNRWLSRIDSLFQNPNFLQIPDKISQTLSDYDRLALQIQQKNIIPKLDSTLQQIQKLIKNFENTSQNLDELLVSSKPLVPKLDSTLFRLDSVLEQSHVLISQFKESVEEIRKNETAAHAFLFKKEFYQDIQKTLNNLNQTLDHIREKRIHVVVKLWGK